MKILQFLYCFKIRKLLRFLWGGGGIILSLSCTLEEGSPFKVEKSSPFSVHDLRILDSLRYLPDDPADMSPSDKDFYRNKPWIIIESISPKFTLAKGQTPDFYGDFNMRLSHMKYLVHTRIFADSLMNYTFVLGDKQKDRPIKIIDEGLQSPKYGKLNKTYHVNPLEVLLVLRNISYQVHVAWRVAPNGAYYAYVGRIGQFAPKRPFNGWDPIGDGGFKLLNKSIIWINSTNAKVNPQLFMHEVMHNWGYVHPAAKNVKGGWPDKDSSKDIPYAVQVVIRHVYYANQQEPLYSKRSQSGHLPNIYDVRKTAKLTTEHDRPSP